MYVPSIRRVFSAVCVCSAIVAAGAPAVAEPFVERLTLRGELTAGLVLPGLSPFQRDVDRYAFVGQGTLRPAIRLVDPLVFQLGFGQWLYPSDVQLGGVVDLSGGLRFEPRIARAGRIFVDGNLGAKFTGPLLRFGFDFGAGFEFRLHPLVDFGPLVRFAAVLPGGDDTSSPAYTLTFGVSLALHARQSSWEDAHAYAHEEVRDAVAPPPRATPRPVADADHDGVLDPDDQCVLEATGLVPDPVRRGCPLQDTDHDGVPDSQDRCGGLAAGEHPDPDAPGCPDADTDRDGVYDHADACRTEPAGTNPDPQHAGCPLPDRDNDTVTDDVDHCPDAPGAPHPDPARNGCPGLVRVQNGQIRILDTVYFAPRRDRILSRSFNVLRAVANALLATPAIHRIEVQGHTDDSGDDIANFELSNRRAASVMRFLVQQGITPERLIARGYGETRPMVPITAEMSHHEADRAREQNRRVEFRIVDPPQLAGGDAAPAAPTATATPAPAPAPPPARPAPVVPTWVPPQQ